MDLPIPPTSDLEIITEMIRQNGLDPMDYTSLLSMIKESNDFMSSLQRMLRKPFSDDPDGLYHDYQSLLMGRDYLATMYARAKANYRISKKRFLNEKGTVIDKESSQDHGCAPYSFWEIALEERIKTLDNRCTAAKQQQRIIEEAMKRNLYE